MSASYTTREAVKSAVDVTDSARANAQIDRLIADASRSCDSLCHREFFPWYGTRRYDWPDTDSPTGWRLWLPGIKELAELNTVTTDGVTIDVATVLLYPEDGPPYDRLEFTSSTASGELLLTGLWAGAPVVENAVSTIATSGITDSAPTLDVPNSAPIGVHSVIRVDTERMTVTEKSAISTGTTLAAPGMTAQKNATAVPLSSATGAPEAGEMIVIDGERMMVRERIGTTAYVERAVDGTVLTTHSTAASIYAYRRLTVQRGVLGTTAAAHDLGATILRWVPHPSLESLTVAKTLTGIAQENSGYARVIGSGEGQREARGAGLKAKTDDVYYQLGKLGRIGAI
jgi:hypothetical protein